MDGLISKEDSKRDVHVSLCVGGGFPGQMGYLTCSVGLPVLRPAPSSLSSGWPLSACTQSTALPSSAALPAPKLSPAMPFDDFSLVATKKCSYQQTDGG